MLSAQIFTQIELENPGLFVLGIHWPIKFRTFQNKSLNQGGEGSHEKIIGGTGIKIGAYQIFNRENAVLHFI